MEFYPFVFFFPYKLISFKSQVYKNLQSPD